MPVHLSVRNAPDEVVQGLRRRAARHHRSLQGELLAIIEEAVRPEATLSPSEVLAGVRRLGVCALNPSPRRSSGWIVTGV